jgi:branched-chain amino acid transport system substrate-binding protein
MVPIATENETPMVGMASAGAIVKDPDTGEVRHWIFKIPHENNQVSQAMVQVLEANGVTSVCHLYENSGYGQDTLAQATAVFEEAGIEILYSDSFERTDTEFPQVVSVQGAGCEAVTVGAIPPGAPLVTAAVLDAMPDMLVVNGSGVCNKQFIELAPEAVEGLTVPCTPLVAGESLPDSSRNREIVVQYINDYTAFTGEATDQFGGIAFDALQWAIIGLSELEEGMDLTARRAAIRDAIENNIKDWPGTSGTFTLTADDHLGLDFTTAFEFVRVEDGGYIYYPPDAWQ